MSGPKSATREPVGQGGPPEGRVWVEPYEGLSLGRWGIEQGGGKQEKSEESF